MTVGCGRSGSMISLSCIDYNNKSRAAGEARAQVSKGVRGGG